MRDCLDYHRVEVDEADGEFKGDLEDIEVHLNRGV